MFNLAPIASSLHPLYVVVVPAAAEGDGNDGCHARGWNLGKGGWMTWCEDDEQEEGLREGMHEVVQGVRRTGNGCHETCQAFEVSVQLE